jgi:hypothetical protein
MNPLYQPASTSQNARRRIEIVGERQRRARNTEITRRRAASNARGAPFVFHRTGRISPEGTSTRFGPSSRHFVFGPFAGDTESCSRPRPESPAATGGAAAADRTSRRRRIQYSAVSICKTPAEGCRSGGRFARHSAKTPRPAAAPRIAMPTTASARLSSLALSRRYPQLCGYSTTQ